MSITPPSFFITALLYYYYYFIVFNIGSLLVKVTNLWRDREVPSGHWTRNSHTRKSSVDITSTSTVKRLHLPSLGSFCPSRFALHRLKFWVLSSFSCGIKVKSIALASSYRNPICDWREHNWLVKLGSAGTEQLIRPLQQWRGKQ